MSAVFGMRPAAARIWLPRMTRSSPFLATRTDTVDPEIARIGLSEKEARARGIPYRVARLPMAAVLRTRTLSETRGFTKALVEADGDRILGCTVFGVEASAILSTVQVAMLAGLPYTALRDAVFAHPTVAEGLGSVFSNIPPR